MSGGSGGLRVAGGQPRGRGGEEGSRESGTAGFSLCACSHLFLFVVCAACWLLFNDARVNVVSPEKVLESQAYMLFYKRKDKTNST